MIVIHVHVEDFLNKEELNIEKFPTFKNVNVIFQINSTKDSFLLVWKTLETKKKEKKKKKPVRNTPEKTRKA